MNALPALVRTVACPACDARYALPPAHGVVEGSMLRCAACGHAWIEARAIEIVEVQSPAVEASEQSLDLDREADRIAAASQRAVEARRTVRRRRRTALRGWAVFASTISVVLAASALLAEPIVRWMPATARLYALAGMHVNVRGLEIRRVTTQFMLVEGTRILAVRGEVANVSETPRRVPAMRFGVRRGRTSELYAWTLASVGDRSLDPGQSTSFLTRIAAPPEGAEEVEIRFARKEEIAVNAGP